KAERIIGDVAKHQLRIRGVIAVICECQSERVVRPGISWVPGWPGTLTNLANSPVDTVRVCWLPEQAVNGNQAAQHVKLPRCKLPGRLEMLLGCLQPVSL